MTTDPWVFLLLANALLLAVGTVMETARPAVDWVRERFGWKVGLLHVTSFRPFPAQALVAALAAGLFLAVNGLHTLNSHFYKSDVATTFFTIAALLCIVKYGLLGL